MQQKNHRRHLPNTVPNYGSILLSFRDVTMDRTTEDDGLTNDEQTSAAIA